MKILFILVLAVVCGVICSGSCGAALQASPGRAEFFPGGMKCYCQETYDGCWCVWDGLSLPACDWLRDLPTYAGEDDEYIYCWGSSGSYNNQPAVNVMFSGPNRVGFRKDWCTE